MKRNANNPTESFVLSEICVAVNLFSSDLLGSSYLVTNPRTFQPYEAIKNWSLKFLCILSTERSLKFSLYQIYILKYA